jgi:acyl-coenzyme A synthetase/AMP-(fatty) acid ligase
VVEAAVVAVPDDLVSNVIKAVVVVRDGSDQRALSAFCAERLPRYMIPELWDFRDRLPQTSTGKVDRQALAADATAGAAS